MKTKLFILFILNFQFLILSSGRAQMTWNQACSFSGTSSSYIAVPHSVSLNITGSFTLEAWVNPVNVAAPSAQIILQKRAAASNGYTIYLSGGRVAIRTNSATRLVGQTVLPNNQWSHIAGLYDFPTGTFTIYINGVYDTSQVIAGAAPITNTDSLLIGKGSNSPFAGKLDEIRIWNKQKEGDIQNLERISLGTNSGIYAGLVLSMTFQNSNSAGNIFSLNDFSGNNNNGVSRGVSNFDLSNIPSSTIAINECADLDGNGDYMSAADQAVVSPTIGITMEAWFYPRSFNANTFIFCPVILKGNPAGTNPDYGIFISKNKLIFMINSTQILTSTTSSVSTIIPLNQWTHIGFTYDGISGFFQYFRNGIIQFDDTTLVGSVLDNTDSLYIGGTPLTQCFDGFIDEIKITSSALSYGDFASHIFTSVNESNDPSGSNVVYNLDGGLSPNSDAGPKLNFRGDTKFSYNAADDNIPVSPLSFSGSLNFQDGYYISNPRIRIPSSGTNGFMVSDTINVPLNEAVSDVNVFVALNHTNEDNLILTLLSPTGTSVTLYSTSSLIDNSDNIVTIFDDQADLLLGSNKYVMFSPKIKPLINLNTTLSGQNTSGKWKLRIQDVTASDTGTLYAWGIQFNNQPSKKKILSLTSLIQGFYNSAINLMVPDSMRVYLRNVRSPYLIIDSSKALLNSSGSANFIFSNIKDGVPFNIQLKHRNSIETWSSTNFSLIFGSKSFSPFNSFYSYDFTNSKTKAFGSNQIQVDSLPNKFAIFSGDVNQDGTVDLADLTLIDNDSYNFTSGYVKTDLNGDSFVDLSDYTLADNNAFNFVNVVKP